MDSYHLSRVLPIILLASAAVFVGSAADQNDEATTTAASGSNAITFHVNAPTTVPDGATIACKARIAPKLSLFDLLTGQRSAPAESSMGFGRLANSSANCTVATPFELNAANRKASAALSYEIDAYTSAGPVFARRQAGIPVSYPRTGATANPPLDVNF
jgi:hypothetical protein